MSEEEDSDSPHLCAADLKDGLGLCDLYSSWILGRHLISTEFLIRASEISRPRQFSPQKHCQRGTRCVLSRGLCCIQTVGDGSSIHLIHGSIIHTARITSRQSNNTVLWNTPFIISHSHPCCLLPASFSLPFSSRRQRLYCPFSHPSPPSYPPAPGSSSVPAPPWLVVPSPWP